MNTKNVFFSSVLWKKISQENTLIFPILVVVFLIFAITEEFFPNFFSFYISQWWFILPVVFSGMIYFFTDISEEDSKKDTKTLSGWKKWSILSIFQGIFTIGFWWKMQDLPVWLFIIIGILFFMLFGLFQIALLFEEDEVENISRFFISQKNILLSLFLGSIVLCLGYLFVWYLFDPYFYEDTLNLENIKNILEIEDVKIDTLKQ